MNNQVPAQQGQQQQPAQPRGPPMYQPNQIRNLPTLTEEEKTKYEAGLTTLWQKVQGSAPNSAEQINARQKIIEFSKMLITKIQQRRQMQSQHVQQQQTQQQAQQQAQQQQAQQQQAQQQAQQQQAQQQVQQQQQQVQQQQQQGQQQAQQVQQNQQQQTQAQPRQQPVQPQGTAQPQPQQAAVANATAPPQGANGAAAAAAAAAGRPNPQAAAPQRVKIPDHIMNHVNKMTFRPTPQMTEKSGANATKWIEEMKERYGRALMTMESSKVKIAQIDKVINDRVIAGNPFKEEELRQLQVRKDQQVRFHQDAHKWVESVRKQQAQTTTAASQGSQPVAQGNASQAAATPAQSAQQQNNTPTNTQNPPTPVNAGIDAAQKQAQMAAAGRPSPVAGTPVATQPQPPRPVASVQQPAQPSQAHPQTIKTEPGHPAPINAAMAAASNQVQSGTSTPGGRVQTPQVATPTTTGGPARALSHSAAMNIANQRATGTPGVPIPGQQPAVGTPASAGGAVNQGIMGSGVQQQQQGHPHAHPTQPQQATLQSKMPIPKQLPERATTVPQGVAVGGGVHTGRPTMTQGSGTLGGVMNQPAMNRIPAYNHEAEGDHVLSKKKLDELVRQVCGGSTEGHGNLLTPEVEEVSRCFPQCMPIHQLTLLERSEHG